MGEHINYLSKEKNDALREEFEYLRTMRRKEIAAELEYARSLGDLSENAEYQQAREQQAKVESRIYELEALLRDAEIITARRGGETVGVGATVTLQKAGEEQYTFEIVGSEEADTAAGRLSLNSPLGSAIQGKREGDVFVFRTPSGKEITYTILKIS